MGDQMNPLAFPLFIVGSWCGLYEVSRLEQGKWEGFNLARDLSGNKGIINLGCGPGRTVDAYVIAIDPQVLVNVDINPDGMPNFLQLDLEREHLPFSDKQFGCAFGSHVLEHLQDWEFALGEMARVADNVVLVLPYPASISAFIHPGHWQHFSAEDMRDIEQRYPTVTILY